MTIAMKTKSRFTAILTTLLLLPLLALPAVAQEGPAESFEGLVEVNEVLLDVLVTDRSGDVVTGLGKDDFVVEEDGERVPVTGVTFYSTRYGPEGEPLAGTDEVPTSRFFILFFHDQRRTGPLQARLMAQQLEAGREARRWVDGHLLPSDWVAVVSYDVKLKIHHDFTQNRHALLEAIDAAIQGKDPEKNLGRGGREMPPSGAPSLLRNLPAGKELRKETTRIYDGIRLLADATGYVVGRKNLVVFTTGWGELDLGGPIPRPDPRYYPPMMEALNDHNVAVYPVDLTPTSFQHSQSHFLNELAADTGGYYYQNFVSFLTPLKEISQENAGYYLLSYQSEHPADEAGYQEVKVEVPEGNVKVRARRGYRYGSAEG
jgi:VWFA-related protein